MDDLNVRMTRWRERGYNCTQIMLLLSLEERDENNPDLVRTMAGLAYGCGVGRATCGALTGGCSLLAFLAVSEMDTTLPSEHLTVMLQTLSDWFDATVGEAHGGILCEDITGEIGPAASRQTCSHIVGDAYAKVLEIASTKGFTL